ncbi:MAG TPA: endonuclease NucS [Candidatus Norongarragalinales archaeon]|nr:endonuclease NucS [Candidatus Norongarragalinales archaeon]
MTINPQQAKNIVDSSLNAGKLCILVGNCKVQYEGRAASKLSEGDRVLMIKSDGTFLVHQSKQAKAVNYQGPGAKILTEINDEGLVVSAVRKLPNLIEKIDVRFRDIYFAEAFGLKDDANLKLFGSERQLSDLLMQDLSLIEPGLVPLQQESVQARGYMDIIAQDSKGRIVVVELKRRIAGLDAVTQLKRYVEELSKRKGKITRGILVAPEITERALLMLQNWGLEYFKLDYEIDNPSARIIGLEKKQKELKEYFK